MHLYVLQLRVHQGDYVVVEMMDTIGIDIFGLYSIPYSKWDKPEILVGGWEQEKTRELYT